MLRIYRDVTACKRLQEKSGGFFCSCCCTCFKVWVSGWDRSMRLQQQKTSWTSSLPQEVSKLNFSHATKRSIFFFAKSNIFFLLQKSVLIFPCIFGSFTSLLLGSKKFCGLSYLFKWKPDPNYPKKMIWSNYSVSHRIKNITGLFSTFLCYFFLL